MKKKIAYILGLSGLHFAISLELFRYSFGIIVGQSDSADPSDLHEKFCIVLSMCFGFRFLLLLKKYIMPQWSGCCYLLTVFCGAFFFTALSLFV